MQEQLHRMNSKSQICVVFCTQCRISITANSPQNLSITSENLSKQCTHLETYPAMVAGHDVQKLKHTYLRTPLQ